MALNFSKTNKMESVQSKVQESGLVSFIKQTYSLFAASLMGGAVGAYVGIPFAATIYDNYWTFVIVELVLLFTLMFNRTKQGLNYILLFGFVFMTGLTIAPLLVQTLSFDGGGAIIGNAFTMTAAIMGIMSYYAIKTEQDFRSFQKPLIIAILVIIGFSLLNIFLFESSFLSVVISGITVLLFTFMVIIDTQNIIKGGYQHPIDGAIALYLDFLNIFLSLLNILNSARE